MNEDHQDFIDAVFKTQVPMPAGAQQETFIDVMTGTLDKECSLSLMQGVHTELMERISVHKESRDPEPLSISPEDMAEILEIHGVSTEQAEAFEEKCREEFGEDAELSPANIIDSRHFKLETPEVKISVDPQHVHLVETRVIDGRRYILIPADNGVELNGMSVSID